MTDQQSSAPYGRLLGIDHGIKRIGLATCDANWTVATELTVLHRKSKKEDFEIINKITTEQNIAGIIVGLPINKVEMETYTQADTVKLWVERYSATTDLPVLLWDEQFSSEDAKELAIMKKRKLGEPIDDLAARIILQSYIDAYRDGLNPPLPGQTTP